VGLVLAALAALAVKAEVREVAAAQH